MPLRSDVERKQRILNDIMDGIPAKEVADKYAVSASHVYRLYRESQGKYPDRKLQQQINELREEMKSIRTLINLFMKQRLQVALKGTGKDPVNYNKLPKKQYGQSHQEA